MASALLGLDATVIVVCHRLAHLELFDTVAVMAQGRIVEHGVPAELLKKSGSALAALRRQQLEEEAEVTTTDLVGPEQGQEARGKRQKAKGKRQEQEKTKDET